MKYKGLKYTKEFEFHIGKEWVGTDVEIEEGEDIDEVYRQVKAKVHQMVTGYLPEPMAVRPIPVPQQLGPREIKVDKVPEEERVSKLIEDLNTCTSIKVLESYKLIAKLNPSVQAAYDLKLKELTEGK